MPQIRIARVSRATAHDLAWFCVPHDRHGDPAFERGALAKEAWIAERLRDGRAPARLAYLGSELVGIIHHEPVPEESAVHVVCLFVPETRHGRQGVGTARASFRRGASSSDGGSGRRETRTSSFSPSGLEPPTARPEPCPRTSLSPRTRAAH